MEKKLREMKNRLSLSVEKLSPTRLSTVSPPMHRKSYYSVPSPSSEGSIPDSVSPVAPRRPNRERSRSSARSSQPSSTFTDSPSTVTDIDECPVSEESETNDGFKPNINDLSFENFHMFSSAINDNGPNSLVDEVMKEVSKISTITEGITKNLEEKKQQERNSRSRPSSTTAIKRRSIYDNIPMLESQENINEPISLSNSLTSNQGCAAFKTISTSSTLNTESTTSGYFSDSASDDRESLKKKHKPAVRAKTVSPIPRYFNTSKNNKDKKPMLSLLKDDDKENKPKKESIYSRLLKSTKKTDSPIISKPIKEPIYAKIKPKLKLETSFKPINPSASKELRKSSELLVKPEPIYSILKKKQTATTILQNNSVPSSSPPLSISSGENSSLFKPIPIMPSKTQESIPQYSSVKHKKERSRTLPFEGLYSKIKKKATRDSSEPPSNSKSPKPIYNQPLPELPKASPNVSRLSSYMESSNYGKVTVKSKEIIPSKPSIVTITNTSKSYKDYDSTLPLSSFSNLTATDSISKISSLDNNYLSSSKADNLDATINSQVSSISGSKMTLERSCSSLGFAQEYDSENTAAADESTSKLNRLVEELAQELETASLKAESSRKGKGLVLKKETLNRLLTNYDVPKNLKRVQEADDTDIELAEKCLLPFSLSTDELRFMDEDENMEIIYADVPDYSQDEFVIALDDENDPKYDSITHNLRRKQRGGDSPGKVSRKSAQVYVNVVNVISALKVLINSNSNKAASVINRMGTLAKPYASKVQTSIGDNTWIQKRMHRKSGHNGFDELRRYIKSGGEFCKEVALILQERAELEATYAKGLHKISTKLVKSSREALGTVTEAWQAVGEELEHEGDIHRIFSASLTEEVVKPLRQVIESQHKIRKGVENMVDKTTKNLHDWRAAENKSKKTGFHNCRENEKVQDMMLDARLGRGKSMSEKDMLKLEKQRRKAEEAVQKSDLEYYSYCIRTERARQEWEMAIYKGSNCFQTLEEERLAALKDLVVKYHTHNKETAPKLVANAARLDGPVSKCDVEKDIQTVIAAKGTGENIPEQTLPDFYSEDLNNPMNKARRRESLEKYLKLIRSDVDRERRGKQGVENLAKALQETPNFGSEDSQQDVSDKLQNLKAMLAYLEAARYKIQVSLDEVNNRPKNSHPLAKHIEYHKDKSGLPVSILKVPPWVRGNGNDISPLSSSPQSSPNWNDRGTADGNSVQPDSDFDEFSSQGSDPTDDYQCAVNEYAVSSRSQPSNHKMPPEDDRLDSGTGGSTSPPDGTYYARPLTVNPSGRCKALYDYEANMYDELTITTGDIINIHDKQPDGWWVGELDGVVGIFPATYVEEID